jgi:hypothetical protein
VPAVALELRLQPRAGPPDATPFLRFRMHQERPIAFG